MMCDAYLLCKTSAAYQAQTENKRKERKKELTHTNTQIEIMLAVSAKRDLDIYFKGYKIYTITLCCRCKWDNIQDLR